MRDSFGVTEAAPAVVEHDSGYTFTWPALGSGFSNWILDVKAGTGNSSQVAFYAPFSMPPQWRKAIQGCGPEAPPA